VPASAEEVIVLYKLSPSGLTYAWSACKCCYARKIKLGISQPTIFPSIFNRIERAQKRTLLGQHTSAFCGAMPPGVVKFDSRFVSSRPITFPGMANGCYLTGFFDIAIENDGGGYTLPDLKTAEPSQGLADFFSPQLHAYANMVEHPADNFPIMAPVTDLGILFWRPDRCELSTTSSMSLVGEASWYGVERDDKQFFAFLREVVEVLNGPLPAAQSCEWCEHCSSGGSCRAGRSTHDLGGCNCCQYCVYRKPGTVVTAS
jgi:PD-(D/E)XK nuclease superfamily protein